VFITRDATVENVAQVGLGLLAITLSIVVLERIRQKVEQKK
jgi:hypothetical protein